MRNCFAGILRAKLRKGESATKDIGNVSVDTSKLPSPLNKKFFTQQRSASAPALFWTRGNYTPRQKIRPLLICGPGTTKNGPAALEKIKR